MIRPASDEVRQALSSVSPCVEVYDSIDSTNFRALALADQGTPNGTVVWADQQTAGRGRRGRTWFSPGMSHLYLSVVLRPTIPATVAPQFTLDVATAVAQSIDDLASVPELRLKWPNDIVVLDAHVDTGFRKLAGILTELRVQDARVGAMVVGVGINIASMQSSPLRELAIGLTDVCPEIEENDISATRVALGAALTRRLVEASHAFERRGGFDRAAWHARALEFGRHVQVVTPGAAPYRGVTDSLDASGYLRIRRGDEVLSVVAGEIAYMGE